LKKSRKNFFTKKFFLVAEGLRQSLSVNPDLFMEQNGFFNIFKPPGMTSHDVVAYLRRRLNPRKIGHGGTLDPAACGVLVCLVNGATKRSQEFTSLEKTYVAEALFGLRTDTGDLDGREIESRPVSIAQQDVENIIPRFTGEIEQTPPMASAVKVGGRKLYELSRRGIEVERAARKVTIHRLELIRFAPHPEQPRALFEIRCSGGTYVRALFEDIGRAAGVPATTSFLLRSAVGPFKVEDALAPDALTPENAASRLLPMDYFPHE
jgi:tRNA pseudouridine55 synthase